MVRYVAFVLVVLVLATFEATLPRLLLLELARPILLVPLVFFFSLKLNTLEGALLSLLAGSCQEAVAGLPAGRSALTFVALFIGARIVLSGVRMEGKVFSMVFSGALALGYHLATLGLAYIFEVGHTAVLDRPWMSAALWSTFATVVCTLPVVALARRVNALGAQQSVFL